MSVRAWWRLWLLLGWVAAGCGGSKHDGNIPDADPALAALGVSRGALDPPFDPAITEYHLALPLGAEDLVFTPEARDPGGASIEIAGALVPSGGDSPVFSLALGSSHFDIVVTPAAGEPQTYAVEVSRGAGVSQAAYLKAAEARDSGLFGFSVALDGDTLAVGAASVNGAADVAYVFARAGDSWIQQARFETPQSAFGFIGVSVALSGDTLAVSASRDDSGATGVDGDPNDNSAGGSGAVYVLVRDGSLWTQQAYIKASNTGGGDLFGSSVALDGDTLAVGAIGEASASGGVGADQGDDSAVNAGAVYVFTRQQSTWSQQAYVKAASPDEDDRFGQSLALQGDTLVVGVPREDSGVAGDPSDNSASFSGAVYVFSRSGATWSQTAYVKSADPSQGWQFGGQIALDGDTLAVSEISRTPELVEVLTRDGESWSPQAEVGAEVPGDDGFGAALAVDGDVLAVGASQEYGGDVGINGDQTDDSVPGAGAAYLFTRSGTLWRQQAYLKAADVDVDDDFGISVAVRGRTVSVGSAFEDSGATGVDGDSSNDSAPDSGAVYVFE